MYENLKSELQRKHISTKAVAELLGCTEKTVSNKITGTTEFTLSEVMLISENLLPEFELRYLFKKREVA